LALLILISLFSTPAYSQTRDLDPSHSPTTAETGRFTKLESGTPVPFDAWCFDDYAFSRINAALQFNKRDCELYTNRLLEKMKAEYEYEIGKLILRVETIEKEYSGFMMIKDQEIKELEEIALKNSNDNFIWWAFAGAAIGTLTTVAIVYAVTDHR